jgi:nucleotide-binding universal stress UspA family protein
MVRIKQILCPIDFSEFSRHAFDRAVAIAKGQGASVTAIHVAPFRTGAVFPYMDPRDEEAFTLSEGERAKVLVELRRFLGADEPRGVPIDCEVWDAPSVHREILAQAARQSADLIVMGTHGRSGFQRLLLGSVTEKVLRTARMPVLTVGAAADAVPAGGTSFKRILCAIDFSECAMAAFRYAASLAESTSAKLTALYVVEMTPMGYDPLAGPYIDLAGYWKAAENIGRERLDKAVVECGLAAAHVEGIVSSGKPHHEILRIASERQSDLIVLGIHGRNPLDRMLLGSTAEPVVRRATCPVLTVRAEPHAASAAA